VSGANKVLGSAVYPSLAGRSVFITGGATGIGEALVRAFVAQRARVHFIDVQDGAGQALAAELGPLARYSHVDVTDVATLQRVIAAEESLDILINNVANDTRHHPDEVTPEFWRNCMAVNLDSTFFAAQAAIQTMKAAGGGAIINFSSINALLGPEDMPGYVSAKAGLLGLTKALARQYGRDHIRVNAILPGWVVTERQLDKWLTPEAEAQWSELVSCR
jgi:D-xylose 1-dehydrogenase